VVQPAVHQARPGSLRATQALKPGRPRTYLRESTEKVDDLAKLIYLFGVKRDIQLGAALGTALWYHWM
jgi:hypothetical protein